MTRTACIGQLSGPPRKFNPLKIPKQLQVCAATLSSVWLYQGRNLFSADEVELC